MIVNIKEELIKPIVNITFFLFLCALTIYGLIHITTNPILQVIIGIVAFVLDLYMLYILSKAKYLWKKQDIINRWKAVGYFVVYTIYTMIYVFLFAVGFFMAELDTNEQTIVNTATKNNINTEQIQANLRQINAYITGQEAENKTTRGKNAKEIEDRITELKEENKILSQDLIETSDKNLEVSTNFLLSLHQVFGWEVKTLKILLFGVLVLLMQFCLISSSFNIKIDDETKDEENGDIKDEPTKDKPKDITELLSFIDGLFEGRNGDALNGINTVSKQTGIPLEKCANYRKQLSELKINDKYALVFGVGFCRAGFDKETIKEFIINN